MSFANFFPEFFLWWYRKGITDLLRFIKAYFSYLYNFFSVDAILKTFFSPWKRMVEARRPGLDGLRDWMIDNLVSRGVAVVLRTALLIFFIVAITVFAVISLLLVIFWVTMPLVIALLFIYIWS